MSPDLQRRFKELAKGQLVYVGGKLTTQNDLCALFTVRAAWLYLRASGRIAFVLPLAALSRGQFERLRSGSFNDVRIAWNEVWTMDDRLQPLFPVPACVVFGERRRTSKPLPSHVRAYTGTLPYRDAPESVADPLLKIQDKAPALVVASFEGGSPYRTAFRDGATLYPRQLCLVERKTLGRLGVDPSAPMVVSKRSNQEKNPWKNLSGVESRVEIQFLRPVLLGESILPYRLFKTLEGVVPVTGHGKILDSEGASSRGFEGLSRWMRRAEAIWHSARPSKMSLIEQFDYFGKLSSQFPASDLRIVYAKAGMKPAACLITEKSCAIDHKLYWYAPTSLEEGLFLTAVINSETSRSRIESQQSRGQWGARDFDKVAFNLPIPDLAQKSHCTLLYLTQPKKLKR